MLSNYFESLLINSIFAINDLILNEQFTFRYLFLSQSPHIDLTRAFLIFIILIIRLITFFILVIITTAIKH